MNRISQRNSYIFFKEVLIFVLYSLGGAEPFIEFGRRSHNWEHGKKDSEAF